MMKAVIQFIVDVGDDILNLDPMIKALIITNVLWLAVLLGTISGTAKAEAPTPVAPAGQTCYTEPDVNEMDDRIKRLEGVVLALHGKSHVPIRVDTELAAMRQDYRQRGVVEWCE